MSSEAGRKSTMSHCQSGRILEGSRPQDRSRSSSDASKVFVSNISFMVRTGELKDFFQYFGRVTQVNLLKDRNRKRSRGMAFVTFSSPEEAERAKTATQYDLTMDGRVMRCSALERRSRKNETKTTPTHTEGISAELCVAPPSSQGCAQEQSEGTSVDQKDEQGQREMESVVDDDSLVNSLPDDIIIKIFSLLSMKERIRIESVCKRWRRLCLATWLSQRSLHFTNVFQGFTFSNDGGVVLNDAIFKSILYKGCHNLRHLDLSASPRFLTARSMNCIGNICRELKYLNLSCSKVDNNSIKSLTNGCRKIETIILKKCKELGEKGIWWLFHNSENLIHVDLEDNRRINGKCFHILNKHCKTVRLEGCCSINDKGLDCLTAKCGQSLEELNISGCLIITDEGFRNFTQRCCNITVLSMCGIHSKLTSAGLQSISKLTKLETLHLTNHQMVDDAVLTRIGLRCRRLRELKIDGCSFQDVTDAGIQPLAKCPQLEILNVSYLGKLTNEGMKSLALAGTLKRLVARSLHITDEAIQLLAAHSPRLYELDVCGCHNLTTAAIQVFLEARDCMPEEGRSPTLTLNFGGTAVTQEALEELGDIDPSVNVCLQNLTAPPGQYYPAILPFDENLEELTDEEDGDDDKKEPNFDTASVLFPLANIQPTYPANRRDDDDDIEYLQVPADSDEPWDGVVDPEPSAAHANGPVAAALGSPSWTQPESVQCGDVDKDCGDGVLNKEPARALSSGPVVAGPGHFAKANPDLAQFVDVEEDLLDGAHGGGAGWGIAEEDVDDFLNADDPAYMDDVMFIS